MSLDDILETVRSYYQDKIRCHGPTPRGVDWSSAESQQLRFRQLLRICSDRSGFSLNDYGCGYGALLDFMDAEGYSLEYAGFDLCAEMVAAAREAHRGRTACRFVEEEAMLSPADFTLASGIFNVKLHHADERWRAHVLVTLDRIDTLSRIGFAFNCLTRYSDRERMRPDLYYADPGLLFDHCRARFSRRVALLHDYPLYEFTILVRKEGGQP